MSPAPPASEPTPPAHAPDQVLVLGLGNDILCDDAVGHHVAQRLRQRLAHEPRLAVEITCEMGLSLLDLMTGYATVVVVDSVQTGRAPPGTVHELGVNDLAAFPGLSPHFLGVGEVLAVGRLLGVAMPERVRIFAVEVQDPFTLGTELTPAVRSAVELAAARIEALLRSFWDQDGAPASEDRSARP